MNKPFCEHCGAGELDQALAEAEQLLSIPPLTRVERAVAMAAFGTSPTEPSEASRIYQACIAMLVEDKDWAQNLIIREVPMLGGPLMDVDTGETRYVIEAQVNRYAETALNQRILEACAKWTSKPVEVLIRYAGPGGLQLEEAQANHLQLVDVAGTSDAAELLESLIVEMKPNDREHELAERYRRDVFDGLRPIDSIAQLLAEYRVELAKP